MKYKRLTKKADVKLLDCEYSCGSLHLDVVKRLGELEDKIENGTLIELPKKCYWAVWLLDWEIIEFDIIKITYNFENNEITFVRCKKGNSIREFGKRDFGEDIFFTKAEAEAKLKEQQNER